MRVSKEIKTGEISASIKFVEKYSSKEKFIRRSEFLLVVFHDSSRN